MHRDRNGKLRDVCPLPVIISRCGATNKWPCTISRIRQQHAKGIWTSATHGIYLLTNNGGKSWMAKLPSMILWNLGNENTSRDCRRSRSRSELAYCTQSSGEESSRLHADDGFDQRALRSGPRWLWCRRQLFAACNRLERGYGAPREKGIAYDVRSSKALTSLAVSTETPTLGSYSFRLVRLACTKCERRGQYKRDRLIAEHGADILLT